MFVVEGCDGVGIEEVDLHTPAMAPVCVSGGGTVVCDDDVYDVDVLYVDDFTSPGCCSASSSSTKQHRPT